MLDSTATILTSEEWEKIGDVLRPPQSWYDEEVDDDLSDAQLYGTSTN